MNQLDQLKQHTTVVADTGDFESIRPTSRRMRPPIPRSSSAAQKPEYRPLLEKAIADFDGRLDR